MESLKSTRLKLNNNKTQYLLRKSMIDFGTIIFKYKNDVQILVNTSSRDSRINFVLPFVPSNLIDSEFTALGVKLSVKAAGVSTSSQLLSTELRCHSNFMLFLIYLLKKTPPILTAFDLYDQVPTTITTFRKTIHGYSNKPYDLTNITFMSHQEFTGKNVVIKTTDEKKYTLTIYNDSIKNTNYIDNNIDLYTKNKPSTYNIVINGRNMTRKMLAIMLEYLIENKQSAFVCYKIDCDCTDCTSHIMEMN